MSMYSIPRSDEDEPVQLNGIVPARWRKWVRHRAVEENTTTGVVMERALKLYRCEVDPEPDEPDPGATPLRLAA